MNDIRAELWVKRDGVRFSKLELQADDLVRIGCTSDAEIKMRLNATVQWDGEFNYNTDTVVPVLVIDKTEKQCGEFIITNSTKEDDGLVSQYRLTGYDLCYLAKKLKTEKRVFFASGTKYEDAISQMLVMAGITTAVLEPSDYVFDTDREDWDPGTSCLKIINDLLGEMNYNSLFMDLNGIVRATRYVEPVMKNATISYYNDAFSILLPGSELDLDAFEHPNVFHYFCDHPEKEEPMHAISVNDDPSNMFSTTRQGRVAVFVQMNNVPDLQTLQAIADKAKFDSMISANVLSFETGLNPVHNPFEIVYLRKKEFTGVIAETEWEMSLGAEGTMRHTGKQVLYN